MNYYTKEEINKPSTEDDCWIYVDNNVYNITEFIHYNPEHAKPVLNNNDTSVRKDSHIGYIQKPWSPFVVEIKKFIKSLF